MPDGEDYPLPKYSKVEVSSNLASFVNDGIAVGVVLVNILLHQLREETVPTCEEGVVKGWEPVQEKYLT